jgi:hypothetical protein
MSLAEYENRLFGIHIHYPKKWVLQENVAGSVVSFSPDLDPRADNPCINVVVQDPSGNGPVTLEEFTQLSLYQMEQFLPGISGLNVFSHELAGLPGKSVEYATNLQGVEIKFYQVFTLKDNMAYIITFSAPVAVHDSFRNLVEDCIKSFKITERKGTTSLVLAPYHNRSYMYFLYYPQNWEKTEDQSASAVHFSFKKNKEPLLHLIVKVDRLPPTQNMNLETYSRLMKNQIEQSLHPNSPALVIEDATLGKGKIPAKKLIFYSDSMLIRGRYVMVWTVQNNHAGVLTFISNVKESDEEQDEHDPIFQRILASFQFVSASDRPDIAYRCYENLTHKFAINFPEHYVAQEGYMGATVSFSVPESPGYSSSAFSTNLNVVVQDLAGHQMTLEEFSEMLKQQLDATVQQCEIQGIADLTIAGAPAKEFKYVGKIEHQPVKFVQRVSVVNNKAVVLSFASERDKFDREFRIAGKYLDSFTFI